MPRQVMHAPPFDARVSKLPPNAATRLDRPLSRRKHS